jgi:hypothetical protein
MFSFISRSIDKANIANNNQRSRSLVSPHDEGLACDVLPDIHPLVEGVALDQESVEAVHHLRHRA